VHPSGIVADGPSPASTTSMSSRSDILIGRERQAEDAGPEGGGSWRALRPWRTSGGCTRPARSRRRTTRPPTIRPYSRPVRRREIPSSESPRNPERISRGSAVASACDLDGNRITRIDDGVTTCPASRFLDSPGRGRHASAGRRAPVITIGSTSPQRLDRPGDVGGVVVDVGRQADAGAPEGGPDPGAGEGRSGRVGVGDRD